MATPRLFITLASNPLAGRWVDATDLDEVNAAIAAHGPDAELMISDAEDWPRNETRGLDPDAIVALADRIVETDGALLAWRANGNDDDDGYEEAYRGQWDSKQAFAEEQIGDVYFAEIAAMPEFLRYRLDWEGLTRDLFCGDFWSADAGNGRVFVFSSF